MRQALAASSRSGCTERALFFLVKLNQPKTGKTRNIPMLQKQYDIQDINTLKARFAYMFTGPVISLEFYKGWFPILAGLCMEIDRVLGEHRACFHWVQIKEKFGVMRLHFELDGAPEPL
jgi:hypothetical protein